VLNSMRKSIVRLYTFFYVEWALVAKFLQVAPGACPENGEGKLVFTSINVYRRDV
jgi:hypothetical protein